MPVTTGKNNQIITRAKIKLKFAWNMYQNNEQNISKFNLILIYFVLMQRKFKDGARLNHSLTGIS